MMATVCVGLVAIWRELRVLGRAARAKHSTDRIVQPMSTHVHVLPTQQVQITGRPEVFFHPERIFISDGFGGSKDWVVNDVKVGGKSVFAQSGDLPGDMFSSKAVDSLLSFPIVEPGQSIVIVATYVGSEATGVPLFASVIGTHVPHKRSRVERRKAALASAAVN